MLNVEEVIAYFKELKRKASEIKDPVENFNFIVNGLNRYSLSEWCEVGIILRECKLI